jgi:exosortase H (IPTLxxWG-CTERM-specific)
MAIKSRLARFVRQQRDGLRFCLLFALFTGVAFAILYAGQNVFVVPLNRHLAWMTEKVLRLVGVGAASSGAVVSMSGFAVEIRNNCNAIYEVGLYAAAVWAYPASRRDRLIGTLLGAAVLYVVNFLRILTLLAVGLLHRSWFDATHLYAWQAIFLVVVGTCWIAWVSRIRPVA